MILSVVKDLVGKYSKSELDNAISVFEASLRNILNVDGGDDGEKLSNLLAASEIKGRIEKGMPMNDAIREFSQRVRSIVSSQGNKGFKKT